MKTVTLTELRRNIRRYVERVEVGETVRVIRHGRPVVDIRPVLGNGVPNWRKPRKLIALRGEPASRTLIRMRRESAR